ncbi:MAG: GNAT family N-acetyltransferase [Anaerolineae bacterium]|nr:GNAT family N-acetyltransferase [Anaerolineae bacterium]
MSALPAPPPVPGGSWRALSPADAPALHALLRALGLENGISPVEDEAYYAGMLADPHADPARNALGLFSEAGALLALGWASIDPDTVDRHRLDLWIDVHPDVSGRGLADFLLSWAEARARQIAAGLPPGKEVMANLPTAWSQADRVARYEAAGYTARHSERFMRRDLAAPLPAARPPDGITILPWTPEHDGLLHETFNAAFADRPGARVISPESWARYYTSGGFSGALSFVALEGARGVGMVRCLTHADTPDDAEIGHVAVVATQRRRGIGRALMLTAMHAMRAAGKQAATLSVSVTNTPAQAAYEALGFATTGGYTSYSKILRRVDDAPTA